MHALSHVETDIEVDSADSRHRACRPIVAERFKSLAVPAHRVAEVVHEVRDEVDDSRLVKTVEHVQPENSARVLEAADATLVQMRERHAGFGIDILVECCDKVSSSR